jgi:hypothetical protein
VQCLLNLPMNNKVLEWNGIPSVLLMACNY